MLFLWFSLCLSCFLCLFVGFHALFGVFFGFFDHFSGYFPVFHCVFGVFSLFSVGSDASKAPISFLCPNPLVSVVGIFRSFPLFFYPFSGYFAVFHRVLVLSSVFSMFSAGFRCISITIAAANRPDCALRLPEAKRHRQSFHQHTQIWSTNRWEESI